MVVTAAADCSVRTAERDGTIHELILCFDSLLMLDVFFDINTGIII